MGLVSCEVKRGVLERRSATAGSFTATDYRPAKFRLLFYHRKE